MDIIIQTFSTRFLGIFIEAVAFLLLGSLISGMIEVFITKEDMVKLVPKQPLLATLMGACLGFLFPVCECGVVPVTRRLYQKGLPISVGVAFLLAAPVMNPIVLASTYAAFGFGPVLIGRFVITFLIAVVVGILFSFQNRPQRLINPKAVLLLSGGSAQAIPAGRMAVIPGIRKGLLLASEDFFEMGRYLVIGTLIATAMQTFISQETLRILATNPVNSVFVMAALAFLLSVCSTVDAFLALSFARTFTTGSILTFLTFGPMVDIKSTAMYLGIFRPRAVLYLVILPFLISTLIGVWLNLNVVF
jgi:uncharacterized membrane protein YraQ (UPF0718 family)